LKEVFLPRIGTSEEDNICNEMSQDGIILYHTSSTFYMMSYYMPTKWYTIGNKNGIDRSSHLFFPVWQTDLGTRQSTTLVTLNMLIFSQYYDYNSMDRQSVVLDC